MTNIKKEVKYLCVDCNQTFKSDKAMKKHLDYHRSIQKPAREIRSVDDDWY